MSRHFQQCRHARNCRLSRNHRNIAVHASGQQPHGVESGRVRKREKTIHAILEDFPSEQRRFPARESGHHGVKVAGELHPFSSTGTFVKTGRLFGFDDHEVGTLPAKFPPEARKHCCGHPAHSALHENVRG